MKIRLYNFKCYNDDTFDFGNNGLVLISGSSGAGKCLGKNTPILMYDGSIKQVQDIIVGDKIMGDDSTPRNVLSLCKGTDTLYEIVPTKGRSYIVNSNHILTLKGDKPRYRYNKNENRWIVSHICNSRRKTKHFVTEIDALSFIQQLEPEPINDICIQEYLRLCKSEQRYNYTFHTGVDFKETPLELDPYLLGVWLGDGTTKESSITIANKELLDVISNIINQYNLKLSNPSGITYRIINNSFTPSLPRRNTSGCIGVSISKGSWISQYTINNKRKQRSFSIAKNNAIKHSQQFNTPSSKGRSNYFTDTLKTLNLLGNKHIPHHFKTNSRENRLKLLAGIIDTDGYVNKNTIEIIQKNKQLSEDIEYLSLSLGFMAIHKQIEKTCSNGSNGRVKDVYYKVTIYGDCLDEIPTKIGYKKLFPRKQVKRATVHGFDINKLDIGEYYGFEISGNGRFLLGDFKVTHNTSILTGIHFALYGTGTDLISDGKNSCFIELDFGDLVIKRTKRPNRLVVRENDTEYEDASGQDIISRRFGSTFETCGYIAQDAMNSFVTMSPIDKLGFLEKFAFRDINLSGIKSRCKNLIKETNAELISITSKLDMTRSVLDEMEKPTKIEFPLKCTKAGRDKAVKNENIRYNNSLILIKKKTKALKTLREEVSDLRVYQTLIKSKRDAISKVDVKLTKLLEEETHIHYKGDDQLEDYQNKLDYLLSFRELKSLERQYSESISQLEEMKAKETDNNNDEIDNISNALWKEYTKSDLRESIDECKLCLEDMERLNKLQSELKRYKINIDDLRDKEVKLEELRGDLETKKDLLSRLRIEQQLYTCPVCQTSLQVCDEDLCVVDDKYDEATEEEIDEIEQEIIDLSDQIYRLERVIPELKNKKEKNSEITQQIDDIKNNYDEIPEIQSLKDDMEYLRQYESSQIELEKKKKCIERNIKSKSFSIAITTFEKDVEKQRKRISELKQKTERNKGDMNEEELKEIIETQKRYKSDLRRIKVGKRDLVEEKSQSEYDIEDETNLYTEKHPEVRDLKELEDKVLYIDEEIQQLETKRDEHATNIKAIQKYVENRKYIIKYTEWSDKLKSITKDEKKAQEKYAAATLLNIKILESESIAMLNVISSINAHTQLYIDEFFPNNPMTVRLLSFKETKKSTKPQINLGIEYKGMESGIGRLSGGEKSRVVLAFTLALADMFNISLLMLDECTSSLDQDLNGIVVNSLKDHFQNKLVLVIAHQSVEGVYDKIISLGEDGQHK